MAVSDKLRIAVLISGGGTTLRNLIDKISAGQLRAEIAVVVSSNAEAKGLRYAAAANIPAHVVERLALSSIDDFSTVLFSRCRAAGAELVVMGGWLKLVTIPDEFSNRVINVHPALIPLFCGKGMYGPAVHRAVIDSGAKISGCTIHFVDNQYDHGPIIAQRAVSVLEGDTTESLAARVFAAECELYPSVINLIADGHLAIGDRR